ncbi:DUF397 domain-containing protein [Streptomyces parvulus]|uniref:DUF397 domain-containing protein n=1 Tax=Streptomyces TaxID=1883 RepID=UPI00136C80E8|nr:MULTISPECIES: DUF397 domain-containing protein [Streptomyces]MCC9154701.1 DUF397 domain-containing protein [Streptomyces parvulus]MCE7690714.1 DUF397 domain-containing protein [Streptomyces parvulus]MZD59034.1 DUF397 domain-containing protein [Streptomyces sp. SID5606]WHM34882.1 DUF397 domain-containing protein [Streptomyces sp. BPPL-273]WML78475.1 DUF397 domain-containing protein [Streptomyces sp. VNUA74]
MDHEPQHRTDPATPSARPVPHGWAKPWSDDAGGACVEVRRLSDGRIALRQSSDPDGPALVFTPHEMTSFLDGVKAGQADFLY